MRAHNFARYIGVLASLVTACASSESAEREAQQQATTHAEQALKSPLRETSLEGLKVGLIDFWITPPVDVSPPPPPPPPPPTTVGPVVDLEVRGDLVFALRPGDGITNLSALEIYDVSGAQPVLWSQLSLPVGAEALALGDDLVAIAFGWSGLMLVDISNAAFPAVVATLPLGENALDVTVAGSIAHVAACTGGLISLDLSSTKQPLVLSRVSTKGCATTVTRTGTQAFIATPTLELLAFDVQDPSAPTQLARLTTVSAVRSLAATEGTLLALTWAPSLLVIDTSDLSAPQIVSDLPLRGAATDLALDAGRIATSTLEGGVHRIKMPALAFPFVSSTRQGPEATRALAWVGPRVAVGHATGIALVDMTPPPCASNVPLDLTFALDDPSPGTVLLPWDADELALLHAVLGLVTDPTTGMQSCEGDGLIDRLARLLGPPGVQASPSGAPAFRVNIMKERGPARGWFDGENIALSTSDDRLHPMHIQILAHELTHAFVDQTLMLWGTFVNEGLAMAVESIVSDVIAGQGLFGASFANCEQIDAPGLQMNQGSSYNALLNESRYYGSGCFFRRLHEANPTGFLRDFVEAASDLPPPIVGAAAPEITAAVHSAAPSCIEGQTASEWLDRQAIFAITPEEPALDVYVGRADLRSAGTSVVLYKRARNAFGEVNETAPTFSAPTVFEDAPQFFNATMSAHYALRNAYGQIVGSPTRSLSLVAMSLFGPIGHWAGFGTNLESELGPCPVDSNGDGQRTCRAGVSLSVHVDYTDPVDGQLRSVVRDQEFVVYRGHQGRAIYGVTRSLLTGRLRITLPGAGLVFDVALESGAFVLPYHGYHSTTALEACSFETGSVPACPLDGSIVPGCPTFQADHDIEEQVRAYRGPVKVERLVHGFASDVLIEPKWLSKTANELAVVY